jgi:hypothetical protein
LFRIKDRISLGITAGCFGNTIKTIIDEISLRKRISQRSFRATASGVWVSSHKEATSIKGQILGVLLDYGLGSLGGIGTVYLLSNTGRDKAITKGLVYGITMGSIITALISGLPQNKIRPKDAASNLSYMLSHAAYGLVTTLIAAYLGDPSLYDPAPKNNYIEPTEPTTEQQGQNNLSLLSK